MESQKVQSVKKGSRQVSTELRTNKIKMWQGLKEDEDEEKKSIMETITGLKILI